MVSIKVVGAVALGMGAIVGCGGDDSATGAAGGNSGAAVNRWIECHQPRGDHAGGVRRPSAALLRVRCIVQPGAQLLGRVLP